MKRYILGLILALSIGTVAGQEPGSVWHGADTLKVPTAPTDLLPGFEPDIRPLDLGPIEVDPAKLTFDDTGIKEMHRTVPSELPRYPVIRMGGLGAYPFLNSERSRFMGSDIAGLGTRVDITEWLTADINVFFSGAYFGTAYPKTYMNASAATTLRLKLHDRVYLLGTGQVSAREGLDPRIAPGLGGKNSLGTGVEIWFTENLGISFTRTWERYRGGWHGHNGFGPTGR